MRSKVGRQLSRHSLNHSMYDADIYNETEERK